MCSVSWEAEGSEALTCIGCCSLGIFINLTRKKREWGEAGTVVGREASRRREPGRGHDGPCLWPRRRTAFILPAFAQARLWPRGSLLRLGRGGASSGVDVLRSRLPSAGAVGAEPRAASELLAAPRPHCRHPPARRCQALRLSAWSCGATCGGIVGWMQRREGWPFPATEESLGGSLSERLPSSTHLASLCPRGAGVCLPQGRPGP